MIDLFNLLVLFLEAVFSVVKIDSTIRISLLYLLQHVSYLHDNQFNTFFFDLLSNLLDPIPIDWAPRICYENNSAYVLKFLAILCNHLDCNNDCRYSYFFLEGPEIMRDGHTITLVRLAQLNLLAQNLQVW